jgi:hypothetical protein
MDASFDSDQLAMEVRAVSAQTSNVPSKLDYALALAGRGFRVFPLEPNGKKPWIKDWPKLATTNEKQIRAWWPLGDDHNIGLATGQGVVVLDYDMKPGQNGQRALDTHDMLGLPMDGFQVKTPSGGRHLYFKTKKFIRNSASKVAKNCDVRGEGGYVVAPGSTIDGKFYSADHDAALPELPEWMAEMVMTTRHTKAADAKTPLTEWDKPENIRRAIDYLQNYAPEGAFGNRNDTTFRVGAHVKDFGISLTECKALMLEHYFGERCPHLDTEGELDTTLDSVYRNGQRPPGIADPKGEFGDVSAELYSSETKQNKLYYVPFHKAADTALETLTEPLIEDLLDCGGLSAFFGPPGAGKTFGVVDIDFHIASGRPWNGHAVQQGGALYVAAEGSKGIYKRFRALKLHYGVTGDVPFGVVPCPINLLDKTREGDTRKLIELIKQAEADFGQKIVKVTIDTLSRALAGGDENSSVDVGTFVKHCDRIRHETGANVAIVGHSGKDLGRGIRGWSGMKAALDTEVEINDNVFKVTKQRDMEIINPIHFRLVPVVLGTDRKGRTVKSCVFKAMTAPELRIELTPTEHKLLDELTAYVDTRQKATKGDKDDNREVTLEEIMSQVVGKRTPTDRRVRSTILEHLSGLSEKGAIKKTDTSQWLIPAVGTVAIAGE